MKKSKSKTYRVSLLLFAAVALAAAIWALNRSTQLASTTPPGTVGSFSFGITRAAAETICRDHELDTAQYERSFPNVGAVPALTCSGLPKPVPYGEFAQQELLFCKGRLCVIKLVSHDGAAYERVKSAIVEKYGNPRADFSKVPSRCKGEALVRCLAHGSAQKLLVWSWPTGFPARVGSMIRLSHTAGAEGEFVFLALTDESGSRMLESSSKN